ncbi:MAG TPA: tRNA uridine-5-carboxymethylaminomethyl(34) synthesis GTPase MnmE [Allosphingosinicella sp.]
MSARDTIFALSSGSPPAAVAIVRISGPEADAALQQMAGRLPEPRRATLAPLRCGAETLDNALILRFPGPASATGEDVAELHLHGGRAVVASVLDALGRMDGLRQAEAGEFTRRAFENGRIDLAEAEGLADLLTAETQSQRRAALAMAGGAVGRLAGAWRERLLGLAAQVEAALDFSDEGEVGESLPPGWRDQAEALAAEIEAALARPSAERLKEGVRTVIAGPPNTGKSSLLNALAGREAAITSAIEGTTRDVVEAPTAIAGTPFLLIDTAGLRESADEIERMGVGRARDSLDRADIILWLGAQSDCPDPDRSILVSARADIAPIDPLADVAVSAVTGDGIDRLVAMLGQRARGLLPAEGEVALNARHRQAAASILEDLRRAVRSADFLAIAESLRHARLETDRITGRAGVEDMLDSLFDRLCIGK